MLNLFFLEIRCNAMQLCMDRRLQKSTRRSLELRVPVLPVSSQNSVVLDCSLAIAAVEKDGTVNLLKALKKRNCKS